MRLWGGRFTSQPSPNAEAFGASIGFDHRLWPYDLMGSAAHCRMLAHQGLIPAEDAEQIIGGLRTIADELAGGQLDLSPRFEDIHTRVEARLSELIGEPAGKLHTARSRNDQVALDLRLFARFALLDEIDALTGLVAALADLAERHLGAILPGYTHLQRAQPVLFAHHALAYVEMFERDVGRLLDCYGRADVLPLGSGALAGVPYPIDRDLVAQLLGFGAISRNSIDAVSDRDFAVEHLGALAIVAMHLSRLAEELILWSSAEFGFIVIDEAYTTGSSIMPHKRNPDVAELVRGKTGRVYGDLMGLLTNLKGQPLAYNKDLQEDKEALFDAVDTARACALIITEMLGAIRLDATRTAAAATASFSLATDYADYLARKGLPFREAHRIVGELVRQCEQSGKGFEQLSLAELQAASPLFDADLLGLSAQWAIEARDVPGGTAPSRVRAALADARARRDELTAAVTSRRQALPSLDQLLGNPRESA